MHTRSSFPLASHQPARSPLGCSSDSSSSSSSSSSLSDISLRSIPSNILYPIDYPPTTDTDLALIKKKLVATESRLNETMREVSDVDLIGMCPARDICLATRRERERIISQRQVLSSRRQREENIMINRSASCVRT
jgi:hypothetical protein